MKNFINHWDEVFAYWVENGNVAPNESHWNRQKERIGLFPELMPEPYIGDPYNCSVVIMNYNPGAGNYNLNTEKGREDYRNDVVHHSALDDPQKMSFHYARDYREHVAAGGYLGRGVDPMYETSGLTNAGKSWWSKRLDWFKELIPDSDKLPFAIELCGWHSHEWKNIKYTPELLAKLKELLAPAIEEAIKNSDLGVGICVGAQWSWSVLPAFGYKDVTGEVMGLKDYKRGWKPLGGTRSYCILRDQNGVYILNTWKSGFGNMNVPKPEFRPIEKEIIERIRAQKSI